MPRGARRPPPRHRPNPRPSAASILRAPGGRKSFHGAREVLDSDHDDRALFATVIEKAAVHSLADYMAARAAGTLSDTDYYARFTAKVKATPPRLEPKRVPVHCVCDAPFNPDLQYVACASCADVFHPRCLGMSDKGAADDLPAGWACARCAAARGGGAAGGV